MVYLLYNRDILVGKKAISMSFKENTYQQMSFTDSFSGLTAREQKALEKSWAKVFADEIFPAIDEKQFFWLIQQIRHPDRILRST